MVLQNFLDCARRLNRGSPSIRRLHTHYSVRAHHTERHEGMLFCSSPLRRTNPGNRYDWPAAKPFTSEALAGTSNIDGRLKLYTPSGIERAWPSSSDVLWTAGYEILGEAECDRGSGTHLKHR
jgi:hypothetical protein